MTKDINQVILDNILGDTTEDIEVMLSDGKLVHVKVKMPTVRDKLEVKSGLSKIPFYEVLDSTEKMDQEVKLLALKIIKDPIITLEQYYDSTDAKITSILDSVIMWYTNKVKLINDKRKGIVKNFLLQQKEE